jgi:neutral ceramidase
MLRTLAAGLICFVSASNGSEPAGLVQAGAARVNITPPLEMKAALGGYGERQSKPATGIHDFVWAKALVLEQGGRKFAMVTADVLAFPHQFKAAVMERLSSQGWTANQILLLPSHSHTSMDMMALHPGNVFGNARAGIFQKELHDFAAAKLAEAVQTAAKNLSPAIAGSVTTTVADRNRNRRRGVVHDTDLTVTRIDSAAGEPLAVLVNWTAHPTFMDENDMLFSGDWPGHLQRTVEALVGGGVTTLYYNGAEGDQSPVPPANAGSNWERAERYGREMGILAWRAWQNIKPKPIKVFAYCSENILLPKRQWHADFMKTGGAEYGLDNEKMQIFVETLVPAESITSCLRLGDLVIAGVPAELAAALGIELKNKIRQSTGAPCVAIGGLANEWVSYALPADEYRKGGYEASMSFYGETLGQTLVENASRAAAALK